QTLNTLTRSVEYVSTRNSYRMAILLTLRARPDRHRHSAGAHDVAVERQAPVQLHLDPAQHADVSLKRIGVERGHAAPLAQIAPPRPGPGSRGGRAAAVACAL